MKNPNDRKDFLDDYPKVTRVEVIDSTWRAYTNYSCENVKISMQDDWRTIKVFLKNKDSAYERAKKAPPEEFTNL